MAFIAAGPTTTRGETDAAGNACFAGLPPGTYSVDDSDTPFEFIDRLDRFCSETDVPGKGVPFASTDRGLRVELEPGQRVVCDVYSVGAALRGFPTATLTVHNLLCPVGFAGPDYYAACHDTPASAGLGFVAEGPDAAVASTDGSGNTAVRIVGGRYEVRGGVSGEFARLAVFRAPATAPGVAFPFTLIRGGVRGPADPSGLVIDLAGDDDDNVVCDWYNTS